MLFNIVWHPKTESDLNNIHKEICERIIKKVRLLEINPYRFLDRLEGYNLYKLHIGDYRVVLNISESDSEIKIFLVGHCSKVYNELPRRL